MIVFLAVAFGVIAGMLIGARVFAVRAKRESPLKKTTYECGESPAGMAWVRFHARYYVVALFFLLFDIEAAFLFPWGGNARELGVQGFVAVVSFVAVVLLGWLWAVRKGALKWQ
ncbi:MAG: NADH-quinone oxidoreductase subunit A [Planctomycetes bacterium]|nr:NADH-quinone oxidoreductase subunit A [Planctomycetota bacterium]MCC6408725.1 NADH-quinone oxidoreductase subunit A [Planctomycetota bacterium]